MNAENTIIKQVKRMKRASREMALVSSIEKNKALKRMARSLIDQSAFLIYENKKDLKAASKQQYSKSLIDRLTLNEKRIQEMADSLLSTARLKDPLGEIMSCMRRPNGLIIKKVRVPIGVIGIIFESRPNVTSDCLALCLKSGNAAILKGGKEAFFSNRAIFKVLKRAIAQTKVPVEAFYLISSNDRRAVHILLSLNEDVDLIVPRGGEGLIRFVSQNSSIPVIKHYKGVCHTYVSKRADITMARKICFNAKVQRSSVCNAMETMLIHKKIAPKFLPVMMEDFQKAGVEIRGCPVTRKILGSKIKKATKDDWSREYLDLILAVKVVTNLKEAIDHINTYGSMHSDAIITEDSKEAGQFLKRIDSATVYVNASTRFTDGYQFGFGAEIGISTDKIHARGPMGLTELTTYKYLIYGKGQIRQ